MLAVDPRPRGSGTHIISPARHASSQNQNSRGRDSGQCAAQVHTAASAAAPTRSRVRTLRSGFTANLAAGCRSSASSPTRLVPAGLGHLVLREVAEFGRDLAARLVEAGGDLDPTVVRFVEPEDAQGLRGADAELLQVEVLHVE